MDSVYLKAKVVRPDAGFDEKASVAEIVKLVDGHVDGEGKEVKGEKNKIVVCSKALKGKDFTDNDFKNMCDLYDEIEAETKAMGSVSIADAKDEADYIVELDKVKKHLDSAKYLAGVKAYNDIASFTELKTAVTLIAEVKEV